MTWQGLSMVRLGDGGVRPISSLCQPRPSVRRRRGRREPGSILSETLAQGVREVIAGTEDQPAAKDSHPNCCFICYAPASTVMLAHIEPQPFLLTGRDRFPWGPSLMS